MDRFPKKPCKHCKGMGHFPYRCSKNPKNSFKKNGLKKNGKYAKQWAITRKTWIKNNPPDVDGKYWICYLQINEWCPKLLSEKTLTIDHVVSRSSDSSLRFSQDNLQPACIYCNNQKGSKKLEVVKPEISQQL